MIPRIKKREKKPAMPKYHFAPLSRHYDYGFGATGQAFKTAADSLAEADGSSQKFLNGHLPINFLYRHSIELFLKSIIVVVHRRLKINYGDRNSEEEPAVKIKDTWKSIYKVHEILDLFEHAKSIFTENKSRFSSVGGSDWSGIFPELEERITLIDGIDRKSTYSRYPSIKDAKQDAEKSSFKSASIDEIQSKMQSAGPPYATVLLVHDENDEIKESFMFDEEPLKEFRDALESVSKQLEVFQFGLRSEIANGW